MGDDDLKKKKGGSILQGDLLLPTLGTKKGWVSVWSLIEPEKEIPWRGEEVAGGVQSILGKGCSTVVNSSRLRNFGDTHYCTEQRMATSTMPSARPHMDIFI